MPNFIRRLIGSKKPAWVAPNLPSGQRIYCIGDIHGRLDLLTALHDLIREDALDFDGEKTLIYIGDYIDRGEQSKEVVDLLLDEPMAGFQPVHLLGNHEQVLLDFLDHPRAVSAWLHWGGLATLLSYGVGVRPDTLHERIAELRDELESRLPGRHLDFFRKLEYMYLAGSYCFVHAGIRPGIPLEEQRNQDLLWIREDFTDSEHVFDHIVVHGHTISHGVEWRKNRIGIDTGAFVSGVLTCLVLEGADQRLLQTGSPAL